MIVLNILLAIFLGLAILVVFVAIIEPASLAIFYSLLQTIFVKNPPIVDTNKHLPKADMLKSNWQVIREELEVVLSQHLNNIPKFHELDDIQKPISDNDGIAWRTFVIKAYGSWAEEQVKLVPRTAELIAQIPEIKTAMFSILEPGKHIPYHRGLYRGIYRYHLGLIVPKEGECFIINGGQKYSWCEGEDILFDDSYRHAVWNNTNETRVVLFADVLRKDLPPWLLYLNEKVYNIRANSRRLKKALVRSTVKKKEAEMPKETAV